ncbi:type II toxin-antitoxin system HicA family toxin [Larkinella sp. VNQ87]|uniref:type II toxin-antitoxin system HicA family toxin n=1 Tax=Larkinella sp. VNQ87 TaxID=3400921 RepID=UPI003BFE9412
MSPFKSIKRSDLIYFLPQAGFTGPESGGKHQFMLKGNLKLTIPNPHQGEISVGLLGRLLKQAGISREEWEKL